MVAPGLAHLVDGEANGEEVGPQLAVFPPVLLHQGHQEAADHFGVVRIVVLLQELQSVLGVGPKRVCNPTQKETSTFSSAPQRENREGRQLGQLFLPSSQGTVNLGWQLSRVRPFFLLWLQHRWATEWAEVTFPAKGSHSNSWDATERQK